MRQHNNHPTQLHLNIFENTKVGNGTLIHNSIPSMKATFKGGLKVPIHRWFRLTPSFGPELVLQMLETMGYQEGQVILDPFAGAGTTMIECQLNGIESYGFEINPFLAFVGSTSLNWDLDMEEIRTCLNLISAQYNHYQGVFSEDDLYNGNLEIPQIHDPFRWWRSDVLICALTLKKIIRELSIDENIRDFFYLGLASIQVPDLTNVELGRLQLHFIKRDTDKIDVFNIFMNQMNTMIDDLGEILSMGGKRTSEIYHADSTKIDQITLPRKIDMVITSPPYPNRYSYVWNTRPHLYFLDFFRNARQAAELDKKTIGGTWGSATSDLIKGIVVPDYPIIHELINPLAEQIRNTENGNLMANYLTKYFNLLAAQITSMDRLLSPAAKAAYVVGCSRLKDVFVETDVLLGKLFEGLDLNYSISSIERIRRRNSGKDLHESIVYVEKTP